MRRTIVAALAAALLLSAAGCSEDEPRPKFADRTESPSASPTDNPRDPTVPALSEPAMPDEARAPTDDGAIAFTEYVWRLVTYSQKSGDTAQFRRLISESCDTCLGAIRAIKRTNRGSRVVTGGDTRVTDASAETFQPSGNQVGAAVAFTTESKRQQVRLDGKLEEEFNPATIDSRFLLVYVEDAWRIDIWRILN